MAKFRRRASDICLSLPFAILVFLIAATIVLLKAEVVGVLIFVGILSLLLVLCDDITVTTLPFLLVCMFVLKCYDSFNTFIVFAPLGVIPIAALLYHIIANKTRFSIGKSFWGIVTVAIAVTCGGWFTLPFSDYFSGTSIFYITGLGIGMIGAYLLMKREFVPSDRYSLFERLMAIFYMAGVFGVFMLFSFVITDYHYFSYNGFLVQWSNNLSTLLMFFLPAPFYFALKKNCLHFFVGLLFYLTIVLTGSRGGFLMGGFELLLCIVYIGYHDKIVRHISIVTILVAIIAFVVFHKPIIEFFDLSDQFNLLLTNEVRLAFIPRAFEDFLANPVFGQGFGYAGNKDLYNPVKGAANWYHMMIPQIIGSLGTMGILGYGYQFYTRFRLIFQKPTVRMMILGLSYSGILLMSQVNPGEFCPIPYELLTVLLFIFLELPREELTGVKKGAFTSLRTVFQKESKKDALV